MTGAALDIEVKHLSKTFGSRDGKPILALDDVSLTVAAGSFVSVVGPSGCGKTTLMRIVAGLESLSSGEVTVGGEVVSRPRRDVAVVFQAPVLFPWLNVLQNVTLPVRILRRDVRAATARAHELLELVGLSGFSERFPRELSGGMRQRVALARALINDPSILLMDEPFGALDAMTREGMNIELSRICAATGKTVLLITHGIAEAAFLSDRVEVLSPRPGRIMTVVDIDVPRPRPGSFMDSPRFGEFTAAIRAQLGGAALGLSLSE